ncbi:hypothetical protein QBC34DRAFT_93825 [Podospora aff. communis PSN243]|uniref:N-acetylglucosamine-induced protein 1 n=1 Tax=Podospora aff. communis PSN243 TaxID=3040156 RepID=A0AAV9GNZ3_9PEZI|nr:hypothetical protein QBC34DRAFT_93825 [Podospora aff. communis PSN243]
MGSIPTSPPLPYWQVNIPPSERTAECPPFLLSLTPKDIGIVSTPDSSYTRDTWVKARQKVLTNRIDLFQRSPSELRQYLAFTWKLKQEYGSVLNFILSSRLHWGEPVVPRGKAPFEDEGDVKILWNDWPYGIDERIVHLVVWTKFELEEDEATGDLTEEARGMVDGYVKRVFGEVKEDKVIWFKNWRYLKSVKAVEHFHVMLFDPDPELVRRVTNGDVPAFMRETGVDPYAK